MIKPSFKLKHFSCPSCKQDSDQAWFSLYADQINNPAGVPLRIEGEGLERLSRNPQFSPDVRKQKVEYWNKVNSGEVFLDRWAPVRTDTFVAGMEISVCRGCMSVAVWLGGEIVHPKESVAK